MSSSNDDIVLSMAGIELVIFCLQPSPISSYNSGIQPAYGPQSQISWKYIPPGQYLSQIYRGPPLMTPYVQPVQEVMCTYLPIPGPVYQLPPVQGVSTSSGIKDFDSRKSVHEHVHNKAAGSYDVYIK